MTLKKGDWGSGVTNVAGWIDKQGYSTDVSSNVTLKKGDWGNGITTLDKWLGQYASTTDRTGKGIVEIGVSLLKSGWTSV